MAATKAKNPYVGKGSAGQNRADRREKTRKEERCQWCHAKVPLKEQFVVFSDLDNRSVKKLKDASKSGRERMSHYCSDCADKRRALKERGFEKGVIKGGSVRRGRPAKAKTAAKSKPAAKGKAKGKSAKKRKVVRRKTAAASASKATDPF